MKIVIPGGSGQVGTILARAFHPEHEVVVLSRRPLTRPWRVVTWDGVSPGAWQREIDGCDAVINLAGRSVNCRYGPENRREILDSRVLSTRIVGRAIAAAPSPPRVWLQASTATIYAHRYDAANDERTGIVGGAEEDAPAAWRFSIDVARAWERAFEEAGTPRTRKLLLRSAMTLSPDPGGVFDTLLWLVRRGLGGPAGDGRQFMSWVHHEDFVAVVRWLIDRRDIDGVVNVAAPDPVPNAEFMAGLRRACGASFALPARAWMVEVGAWVMRTESELILKSRRVVPGRLLERGFLFRWPTWANAAVALCDEWNALRAAESRAARRRLSRNDGRGFATADAYVNDFIDRRESWPTGTCVEGQSRTTPSAGTSAAGWTAQCGNRREAATRAIRATARTRRIRGRGKSAT